MKDDEFNFPTIPNIPNLLDARFSSYTTEEIENMIDNFLIQRQIWKDKWEHMTKEHQEVLEKYVLDKLK